MKAEDKSNYSMTKSNVDMETSPALLKEVNRHEMIVMIYRLTAIIVGLVIILLGYELFTALVIDPENVKNYQFELERDGPGLVLGLFGLLVVTMGLTKLMPLPKFKGQVVNSGMSLDEDVPDDGIPVLTSEEFKPNEDMLWKNNVKPLLSKVASNERISPSDRELLRKWLQAYSVI